MNLLTIKVLAFYTLFIAVISVLFLWIVFKSYPFITPELGQTIPIDKTVYYPGDTVVFILDGCLPSMKLSDVSVQLENEPGDNWYFQSLNTHVRSVGLKGCFKIKDLSTHIPYDFFTSNEYTREGKHFIRVFLQNPQNPFADPIVYETVWFDIRKSDKIKQ